MAPAQGGKTDDPALNRADVGGSARAPVLLDATYADVTKTLSLEVDMPPAALAAFYQGALGKAGWRATTDKLVKIDFDELMIFRNDAKDIATLKVHLLRRKAQGDPPTADRSRIRRDSPAGKGR